MFFRVVLLFVLTLTLSKATLMDDFVASLPEIGEEVDKVIMKDFIKERHNSRDIQGLKVEFQAFKKLWT